MKRSRQTGFSLIELVIVMTIVTLCSVPILQQFTQVAITAQINEEIQTASQLAQERAEQLLAQRREQGYDAVAPGTTTDTMTSPYAIFSRRVIVSEPSTFGGCAPGADCKGVTVTVSRGPKVRAQVSYVIVDY